MMKIGSRFRKKAKEFTLKKIDNKGQFTYYHMLEDGLPDELEYARVYGKKVILSEFKLIKEVKDG